MKVKEIAIGIKHFGINCRFLTQSTSEGEREGEGEAGGQAEAGEELEVEAGRTGKER